LKKKERCVKAARRESGGLLLPAIQGGKGSLSLLVLGLVLADSDRNSKLKKQKVKLQSKIQN
jgi:hypothetical protein